MPFDQRSLSHLEAWFPPCFVRQNRQKKTFFLRGDFRPLPNKHVQMLDHFFPLFFPKDSESLKIFDILLREVGVKRPLNGTSKVNRQTNRQTDRQTDRRTFQLIQSIGPEGRCFENHWICDHDHTSPDPPLFFENCDCLRVFFLRCFLIIG